MVLGKRIELLFTEWKPAVLATWLTEHINLDSFAYYSPQSALWRESNSLMIVLQTIVLTFRKFAVRVYFIIQEVLFMHLL